MANGLAHPEVLAAVASCNLSTRSVFHRLYEREEKRLEEATDRIGDLEKELTRGGLEVPTSDEFRKFHESRQRWERQTKDSNLKALQVVELKEAIGQVLGRFELSGLAAEDIDEALELVEEVEGDAEDDRVLEAVRRPGARRRRAVRRRDRAAAHRPSPASRTCAWKPGS